jgi:hypothetical protein
MRFFDIASAARASILPITMHSTVTTHLPMRTAMNAHKSRTCLVQAAMLGAFLIACGAHAEEDDSVEGFLSDYSKLAAAPDNPFDEVYIAPTALARLGNYNSVMIDQPEIFIHPDSKYKGAKPDDLKLIADGLREAVARELYGSYQIVEQPGTGVLLVRMAVGDLVLQKRKRNLLAYTPAGAVIYAAKNALTSDMMNKIDLKNMKVEGEVLDSQTQEQLGALTTSRGSLSTDTKEEPVSWKELETTFSTVGKRLRCRLDNAHVAPKQQQRCGAIGLAASTEADSQKR